MRGSRVPEREVARKADAGSCDLVEVTAAGLWSRYSSGSGNNETEDDIKKGLFFNFRAGGEAADGHLTAGRRTRTPLGEKQPNETTAYSRAFPHFSPAAECSSNNTVKCNLAPLLSCARRGSAGCLAAMGKWEARMGEGRNRKGGIRVVRC